ncbi:MULTISPECIES: endonuclease/exonuclease/phosphatase family protein [unclassified Methylobacterium]|uniref:endonuclease/exonuclease/phosphatase family protein n=1 Tax=unclassified Methylobacterium TaxID=2615210 RepID=UPI000A4F4D3D|nr:MULTISPECIES: endonuclease/exonuclease/phosphatase family protein [unclassified Methylobacterium]
MLNDRRLADHRLSTTAFPHPGQRKILSWNLLRRVGANVAGIATLIEREQPDLVLMQEATRDIDGLKARLGGDYAWAQLPGRIHGLAIWSRTPFVTRPEVIALPSGALIDRVCQVLDLGDFGVANVHLSHGQVLNRRQLRRIALSLPERAAVIGDFNLVGPPLLPGFTDAGPRRPTHAMGRVVPLRLDRCLVRGLVCQGGAVLPRGASDHRPIVVHLAPAPQPREERARGRNPIDRFAMRISASLKRRAGL